MCGMIIRRGVGDVAERTTKMPRYLRDGPGLLRNCQRGGGLLTGGLVSVAGSNPPKVRVRAMIYIFSNMRIFWCNLELNKH